MCCAFGFGCVGPLWDLNEILPFLETGDVFFVGVLVIRALLFGVYIGTPLILLQARKKQVSVLQTIREGFRVYEVLGLMFRFRGWTFWNLKVWLQNWELLDFWY